MSKTKATVVAVFAALMLSMVGAASASAAQNWFITGTELKAGTNELLANTAAVDEDAVLNAPGLTLKVTCNSNILGGSKAEIEGGTAMGQAEALEFNGCTELTPPNCNLVSSIIRTHPLLVLLLFTRRFPYISITFHLKTGNLFTELEFGGGTCPFAGAQGVKGSILIGAPTGGSEEVLQAIEGQGTTENNSLEIDGQKAYLEGGKALLKLASGLKWSFRE